MQIWLYTLGSTLLVSLISLMGIFTLSITQDRLQKILLYLVSFAAGALLGDALFHILPEVIEEYGFGLDMSLFMLAGILAFFILEKFVQWHHCHHVEDQHHMDNHKAFIATNLLGDGLHNFVDGIFIASSYLVSIELGIATTIAVALHEIPQEVGDFGILMHGGVQRKNALKLNFLSALAAMMGAVVGLSIGEKSNELLPYVLTFTAGGFIYIACTDLFPELHKRSAKLSTSLSHLILILGGIATMMALLLLE